MAVRSQDQEGDSFPDRGEQHLSEFRQISWGFPGTGERGDSWQETEQVQKAGERACCVQDTRGRVCPGITVGRGQRQGRGWGGGVEGTEVSVTEGPVQRQAGRRKHKVLRKRNSSTITSP